MFSICDVRFREIIFRKSTKTLLFLLFIVQSIPGAYANSSSSLEGVATGSVHSVPNEEKIIQLLISNGSITADMNEEEKRKILDNYIKSSGEYDLRKLKPPKPYSPVSIEPGYNGEGVGHSK